MFLPYIVIIPFCQGLVAGDKETSTAWLIYFAAPEYFRFSPLDNYRNLLKLSELLPD